MTILAGRFGSAARRCASFSKSSEIVKAGDPAGAPRAGNQSCGDRPSEPDPARQDSGVPQNALVADALGHLDRNLDAPRLAAGDDHRFLDRPQRSEGRHQAEIKAELRDPLAEIRTRTAALHAQVILGREIFDFGSSPQAGQALVGLPYGGQLDGNLAHKGQPPSCRAGGRRRARAR